MAAQATAPASPALLSARGSLPTGVPGAAPVATAARANRVQTVGSDHLHWAQGAMGCRQRWAPGLSAASPVGVHRPIGPPGLLVPWARAMLLLGLFPGGLILSFGAITVPPLGHLRAPLPSMVEGPSAQWNGGCPAASAQIEGIFPFVDRLGHGLRISTSLPSGSLLGAVTLARSDGLSEEPFCWSLGPGASDLACPLSSPLASSSFRITFFSHLGCLAQVIWVG